MSNTEKQAEALGRAIGGHSLTNYPAIFHEFMARGIPEDQIKPRENVFSYNAWKAIGRQVRKGEHGVKILTFISIGTKEAEQTEPTDRKRSSSYRRPWSVTVFHISQTDAVKAVQS